jgi:hypothetical protein
MNATVLKVSVWSIIVLLIIAGCTDKAEAAQLQSDMPLPGASSPVTDNKRNFDIKSKWGYCYNPEMTMHFLTQLKVNEYRAYQCANESGWTGYFEIYYKNRKIYTERVKNGHFFVCDPNDPLNDCSNLPAGKDINGDDVTEMVMVRNTGQGLFSFLIIFIPLARR